MDTNKKKKNSILHRIDKVEMELLQNDEYAKQFLEDEGFNTEEELKYGSQFIRRIRFMASAIIKKQEDLKLFEMAYLRIKTAIHENTQKTSDTLISLLQTKSPSFQFRNLESWTDDEIREVLADIDLVKLMEEFDKEK
jgi:hypothetical protein